jgi:hypothetical protein
LKVDRISMPGPDSVREDVSDPEKGRKDEEIT